MDYFGIKDPNLDGISAMEIDIITRTFLELYRESNFCPRTGRIVGERKKPMVYNTVKEVARSLGKTLWDNFEFSPFHKKGNRGNEMTPNIRDLLSGMESISPNSKQQKAMTPDLLRCFAEYANDVVVNSMEDHAADLIIGAFFFAMRSCEFTMVTKITKTIAIRLGGIRFYTKERRLVPHNHPQLL